MSLRYGRAEEVAEELNTANHVSHEDILSALINALKKIDQLERRVATLEENPNA